MSRGFERLHAPATSSGASRGARTGGHPERGRARSARLGHVHAQAPVHAAALDAQQHAQVERGPVGVGRAAVRACVVAGHAAQRLQRRRPPRRRPDLGRQVGGRRGSGAGRAGAPRRIRAAAALCGDEAGISGPHMLA